jgi:hypothetical protein
MFAAGDANSGPNLWQLANRYGFLAASALLFVYLAYTIIRKRRGARAGASVGEPEI